MSEERFDPRRHNLDYAAKRLDELSRKTYPVPVPQPELTEERCWSCEHAGGEMLQFGKIRIHNTPDCRAIAEMTEDDEEEKSMSEEDTNELATGGVIENGGLAYNGPDSPEVVFTPRDGIKASYTINGWPANNPTLLNPNPGGVSWTWLHNAAAGSWIPPVYSQPITYKLTSGADPLTEERIREIVAETMHKVLYPESDGVVSAHEHWRVRQWDQNGREWRGVLYPVEKESEM